MVTFDEVKNNSEIKTYIEAGNENLGAIGFTEHGFAHAMRVATDAARILQLMGYDERTCELGMIAGYVHDIGNVVNRSNHALSGALMAFNVLSRLGMEPREITVVVSAIGHHDEGTAFPVNAVAAALILSDKGDVRRTRVRDRGTVSSDIHDRVNYAVERSQLDIWTKEKIAHLELKIDTDICPVMEYFEIFIGRMVLCRKAGEFFGLNFELTINGTRLL